MNKYVVCEPGRLIEVCKRNGWLKKIKLERLEKILNLNGNMVEEVNATIKDVALAIWLYSDNEGLDVIENVLMDIHLSTKYEYEERQMKKPREGWDILTSWHKECLEIRKLRNTTLSEYERLTGIDKVRLRRIWHADLKASNKEVLLISEALDVDPWLYPDYGKAENEDTEDMSNYEDTPDK